MAGRQPGHWLWHLDRRFCRLRSPQLWKWPNHVRPRKREEHVCPTLLIVGDELPGLVLLGRGGPNLAQSSREICLFSFFFDFSIGVEQTQ